jgi:hypothetical protein
LKAGNARLPFFSFGGKFQAAWVAARFRGQFQEPATVNLGAKNLCFRGCFYKYFYQKAKKYIKYYFFQVHLFFIIFQPVQNQWHITFLYALALRPRPGSLVPPDIPPHPVEHHNEKRFGIYNTMNEMAGGCRISITPLS